MCLNHKCFVMLSLLSAVVRSPSCSEFRCLFLTMFSSRRIAIVNLKLTIIIIHLLPDIDIQYINHEGIGHQTMVRMAAIEE